MQKVSYNKILILSNPGLNMPWSYKNLESDLVRNTDV